MATKKRVVITGIGIISPLGMDTATVWNNCLNSVTATRPVPSHWLEFSNLTSRIWATLPSHDLSHSGITRTDTLQYDFCQQLAIAATTQALQNAQIRIEIAQSKKGVYALPELSDLRTGVFVGTGAGGITSLISSQAYHILSAHQGILPAGIPVPNRFNPFTISMLLPSSCSSIIGIRFSLHGINRTICSACSSGTDAIGQGFRAIRDGLIDCALCGATEFVGDSYGGVFRAFDTAKTLTTGKTAESNCPFDISRSGFLFSEGGAAMLFMEEEQHALSRNVPIVAQITGYAEKFDSFSIMALDPKGEVISEMIQETLLDANADASEIDYINAHGTGTIPNDEIECSIINAIFGKHPFVNSTKSMTGHTLGACGAIEAAITVLSIVHEKVHPCVNLRNPLGDLNFPMSTTAVPLKKALTETFAFGGHHSALIFEKYP